MDKNHGRTQWKNADKAGTGHLDEYQTLRVLGKYKPSLV